jgi:branched-chain amino acid transport system substrate-binding protein
MFAARLLSTLLLILTLAGCAQHPLRSARDIASPVPPGTHGQAGVTAPLLKIAVLVPLSGPSAPLGQGMLDAAMLALQDKYPASNSGASASPFILLPRDTGNDATRTLAAYRSAVKDGAQLVLGPVFGATVSAIAPEARKQGIPVIAFTNDRSQARPGVFVMGISPENQVARVVAHAASAGKQRIAALLPGDMFGSVAAAALHKAAATHKLPQPRIVTYPAKTPSITAYAQELLQGGAPEAVLVPEGGEHLAQAAAVFGGVATPPMLLGSSLWDDTRLTGYQSLKGARFPATDPQARQGFMSRFHRQFGYAPPKLAGLAYDATMLSLSLMEGRGGLASQLTTPAGFDGPAEGAFRFLASGEGEHALAILEVTPVGVRTVEPAPQGW